MGEGMVMMVDIFTFCTDIEIVFSGLINKYKEVLQHMVILLGKSLVEDTIPRLMRVEFRFMPRWLHRKVRVLALYVWRDTRSRLLIHNSEGGC